MRTPILLAIFISLNTFAANWPTWRGPTYDGIVPAGSYPTSWSPKENIAWRTELPGGGNSTPVIWNQKVFVTCATEKGAKRFLMCFNRADGKLLWERTIEYTEKEPTHDTNPYCSATPVTDGERVICSFGSAGEAAYDFDGKLLWHRKDLGPLTHIWGNAGSPILDGDQVIQFCGPGLRVFLIALDKKTGETKWQLDLPEAQAPSPDKYLGSWSTPFIRDFKDADGKPKRELIMGLPKKLVSLDLETHKTNWFCEGAGDLIYTNPLVGKDVIALLSGYGGPAIGVKVGGSGDVTATHRLWRITNKNPQRVGSGIVLGDHFYILNDSGVAQCTELATGKDLWSEKVAGSSWSSMCVADGKLYVIDQGGKTVVMDAAPTFKLIKANPLGEPTRASLAFSDGQIFIRTYKALYCVSEKR